MLKIIYAVNAKNVIGRNNKLPWHLPPDLKRFADLTTGDIVVMGHNTWQSLPGKQRPLKDRTNIVLSRDPKLHIQGVTVMHDLEKLILETPPSKNIWVIGGSAVFKHALPYATEIYQTQLHTREDGDRYGFTIGHEWLLESESEIFKFKHIDYQYRKYVRA